jgi:hypothetical protein
MATERSPLLRQPDENAFETAFAADGETKKKPPYSNYQVIILCIARAVETGSFSMQAAESMRQRDSSADPSLPGCRPLYQTW